MSSAWGGVSRKGKAGGGWVYSAWGGISGRGRGEAGGCWISGVGARVEVLRSRSIDRWSESMSIEMVSLIWETMDGVGVMEGSGRAR